MESCTTWWRGVAFCTRDACGVEFEAWDINCTNAYLDKLDPGRHERAAAVAAAALEAARHKLDDETVVPFEKWYPAEREAVLDELGKLLDD